MVEERLFNLCLPGMPRDKITTATRRRSCNGDSSRPVTRESLQIRYEQVVTQTYDYRCRQTSFADKSFLKQLSRFAAVGKVAFSDLGNMRKRLTGAPSLCLPGQTGGKTATEFATIRSRARTRSVIVRHERRSPATAQCQPSC